MLAKVTGPTARRELHEFMGVSVREELRGHLAELAQTRHATAERLGATPSGHLAQAARAVEGAPVTAEADSATITINHPGLVRAFRDVTILPKKKFLTIPLNALAYNRRAGQFAGELFVFKSKTTGDLFLAKRQAEKGDMPLLMYALVRSVTQKQDRTLLSSDEELHGAAVEGGKAWFEKEIGGAS